MCVLWSLVIFVSVVVLQALAIYKRKSLTGL